jgi:hypothetical protein
MEKYLFWRRPKAIGGLSGERGKSRCQKPKRYVPPGNLNREITAPDPTQARHICHFIW